jgi:hypothetical protein
MTKSEYAKTLVDGTILLFERTDGFEDVAIGKWPTLRIPSRLWVRYLNALFLTTHRSTLYLYYMSLGGGPERMKWFSAVFKHMGVSELSSRDVLYTEPPSWVIKLYQANWNDRFETEITPNATFCAAYRKLIGKDPIKFA